MLTEREKELYKHSTEYRNVSQCARDRLELLSTISQLREELASIYETPEVPEVEDERSESNGQDIK